MPCVRADHFTFTLQRMDIESAVTYITIDLKIENILREDKLKLILKLLLPYNH